MTGRVLSRPAARDSLASVNAPAAAPARVGQMYAAVEPGAKNPVCAAERLQRAREILVRTQAKREGAAGRHSTCG